MYTVPLIIELFIKSNIELNSFVNACNCLKQRTSNIVKYRTLFQRKQNENM